MAKGELRQTSNHQLGDEGLEPPQETSGIKRVGSESGAECGALGAHSAPADADLAAVIAAWPGLPTGVRQRIVGMVQGAD